MQCLSEGYPSIPLSKFDSRSSWQSLQLVMLLLVHDFVTELLLVGAVVTAAAVIAISMMMIMVMMMIMRALLMMDDADDDDADDDDDDDDDDLVMSTPRVNRCSSSNSLIARSNEGHQQLNKGATEIDHVQVVAFVAQDGDAAA